MGNIIIEGTGKPFLQGNMPIMDDGTRRPYLGDIYQGGVIFYIDNSGWHGLIAAVDDNGCSMNEGGQEICYQVRYLTSYVGATGNTIGSGDVNTNLVDATWNSTNYTDCIFVGGKIGMAAHVCKISNLSGYTDWYLPSAVEMELAGYSGYVPNLILSFVAAGTYWTSSEIDSTHAYMVSVDYNHRTHSYNTLKEGWGAVRQIRKY